MTETPSDRITAFLNAWKRAGEDEHLGTSMVAGGPGDDDPDLMTEDVRAVLADNVRLLQNQSSLERNAIEGWSAYSAAKGEIAEAVRSLAAYPDELRDLLAERGIAGECAPAVLLGAVADWIENEVGG